METTWEGIKNRELRYLGHTWTLTGDVEVRDRGDLIAVSARQADDVRRRAATLYFGVEGPSDSLNPGNLSHNFARLERNGESDQLVVKGDQRTYRYDLHRMEYA